MEELEELVIELAAKAQFEERVVIRKLSTGLQLLVYPLADNLLVALGFEAERGRQVRAEAVLRKRSQNLKRYGAWLPAQLLDGSWYVIRRLRKPRFPESGSVLSNDALTVAQELLA